jgi:hypothetical protein
MGQDEDGLVKTNAVRHFSLRNEFADQWYHLMNPVNGRSEYWHPSIPAPANGKPQTPYLLFVDLKATDFMPNEDRRSIKKITVVLEGADDYQSDKILPVFVCLKGADGQGQTELTKDRIAGAVDSFNGKSPHGRWILGVGRSCKTTNTADPSPELAGQIKDGIRDLWLVVEYGAYVHYNRN